MNNKVELRWLCCALLIAGLLCVVAACSSQSEKNETAQDKASAAELVAQADKLYPQRADLKKVREGILLLRRAFASDSSSYDAAWRLARLEYYLGDSTEDSSERDIAFSEGIDAGRRAVKLQDEKPEGHFWLGASLGGKAETSTLSGLTSVDEIRSEMQKVIRLDEGFEGGSAYMVLGQVDLEAPKMLGGDQKRAVEELEKGLRFGADNMLLRLHLAEAYLAVNRKEDARKQLETIINGTPNPDYLPEYQEAMTEAKKLLEKTK